MASFSADEEDQEHFSYAFQLVNLSALSMAMQAAIELGIFEIIAKSGPNGKLSPSEIAAQMPTKNPDVPIMLDRILRLLVTHSVLSCSLCDDDTTVSAQRLYGLAPVAKFFVRNENGVSLGPLMALTQDKVYMDSWSELKSSVLEGGIPFNRRHGMHAFEFARKDPRFSQVLNTAMLNHTTIVAHRILEAGFEHIRQLVDVGGGLGVNLSIITSKYPFIRGINFDLPHVIQHAPTYPGVEHVDGDMFESVPEGEAIFMKWILHDWSNGECLKLLKKCYDAIPVDGKVIVVEAVISSLPESSAAEKANSEIDVLMMTQNPGGKERTQQEFMALARGARYTGIRFQCFVCNFWVMEFYK